MRSQCGHIFRSFRILLIARFEDCNFYDWLWSGACQGLQFRRQSSLWKVSLMQFANVRPSSIIRFMGRSIIWFRSTHGATDDWATRFCHLLSFPPMLSLSICLSPSTIPPFSFFFFPFFSSFPRCTIYSNVGANSKCTVLRLGMWICRICIPGNWRWTRRWSCRWMARKRGFSTPRYFLVFKYLPYSKQNRYYCLLRLTSVAFLWIIPSLFVFVLLQKDIVWLLFQSLKRS